MKTYLVTYIVANRLFLHFILTSDKSGEDLVWEVNCTIVEKFTLGYEFSILNLVLIPEGEVMKTYLIAYIVDDALYYHFTMGSSNTGEKLITEIEDYIREEINDPTSEFAILNIVKV